MLSRPRRPGRRLGRGPRPLAIGSRRRAPAPRGVDEPGIAAMAAQGQRRLVAARGVVGCLFVGLLVLFALALAVRYVVAVVRGLSLRPPMDCSDWSPGKMAESPHDLACEAQWDDQLNELNPQPRVRYRGRRRPPVS